ncbi:hypothetical protein CYMTET_48704 [Cymbomonas tetramitiformis]|uniref:Uncharacterized protein n=1 Tax=Cymbomonas tetramitiformis TaxID=36881 RepID=A0AAE0BRP1_9CHLO|nr:hypothetical protein CYMTET_48704 [Cymbomonas tetramitiformis]
MQYRKNQYWNLELEECPGASSSSVPFDPSRRNSSMPFAPSRRGRKSVVWDVRHKTEVHPNGKLYGKLVSSDLFHFFFRLHFFYVFLLLAFGYVVTNLFFALMYWFSPHGCVTHSDSLGRMYFFSVYTFSTVGYGYMAPTCLWAHVWTTVETFVSIVCTAMATSFFFAKISKPDAKIVFSSHCVLSSRNGSMPRLEFRIANERTSEVVEAKVNCSVALLEELEDGSKTIRYHPMQLERDFNPMFSLSWTLSHKLNEDSPLVESGLYTSSSGEVVTDIKPFIVIVVSFTGIDDIFAQGVHARKRYIPADVRKNEVFENILHLDDSGQMQLRVSDLSKTRHISDTSSTSCASSWSIR